MTTYSVAEAKNRLSELIDRALAGEGVTITRRGRPVVTPNSWPWARSHSLSMPVDGMIARRAAAARTSAAMPAPAHFRARISLRDTRCRLSGRGSPAAEG